jgi:asparagine synthase (glutamine-hydrolysing)
MCGINGIVTRSIESLQEQIQKMNNQIIHRGPDDSGFLCIGNVAMGMQRLSIIDLSTGHQPMFNSDNSISIVFNGEIYNYKEVKERLITEHKVFFRTTSDTEVILKGYEVWGTDVLKYLNGMFAFSVYDQKKSRIFIGRDRFGEKPLYLYKDDEQVLWASELKSIIELKPELKEISSQGLNLFLSLTYIPAPYTIYKNISKLRPGCFILLNATDLSIVESAYWDIDLETIVDINDYEEAKIQLRSMLFDSVEKRMIADVPIGVFLSGGVDSTIIAAIMSKHSDSPIKTFSIGYSNPKYDESARAKIVSKHIKSEHHEYTLDYADILQDLDKVVLNYDEPFSDSSCLPTYFVSQKAAEHVKVVLTGDGGDEVFGGYNKYLLHSYGKVYASFIPKILRRIILSGLERVRIGASDTKSSVTKLRKLLKSLGGTPALNHINIISLGFHEDEKKELLSQEMYEDMSQTLIREVKLPEERSSKIEPLKIARYLDKNISLEGDMLVKVDRASMLCSLECRSPFLDHRLMELSYRMPDDFLIRGNYKKRILKDTFKDLLPHKFFNSSKSGFEVPISSWLRNELKDDLLSTLSEVNLNKHGLFNYNYVSELIADHIQLKIDRSSKLWSLLCFQKWYNHHFKN